MAIQFPDFQRISFDEANPMLTGMAKGQALMQNFMAFPQDLQAKILANQIAQVQAQYAQPTAEGNLKKLGLENQWYAPKAQAEIGLQGAQAGLAGAQTGLAGNQSRKVGIEADQAKMMLDMLSKRLGAGSGGGSAPSMGGGQPAQAGAPQGGSALPSGSAGGRWGAGADDVVVAKNGSGGAQGGSPGMAPPQQPQQLPPTNEVYGIPTPTPTNDDLINQKLLGINTFGPKQTAAIQNQQAQFKSFQEAITESQKAANIAQQTNQTLARFNHYMDNSTYRGSAKGTLPSSGWQTFGMGDMSNEQNADMEAARNLPQQVHVFRDEMKAGQFTNKDMDAVSNTTFNRHMDDNARAVQTQIFKGVNDRMTEIAKIYSVLGNPQSGAQKINADQAVGAYQQNFPLTSNDGKSFNAQNVNHWALFTTPRAIASLKATGSYKPSAAELNSVMMSVPDGKGSFAIVPIAKKDIQKAIKMGAQTL